MTKCYFCPCFVDTCLLQDLRMHKCTHLTWKRNNWIEIFLRNIIDKKILNILIWKLVRERKRSSSISDILDPYLNEWILISCYHWKPWQHANNFLNKHKYFLAKAFFLPLHKLYMKSNSQYTVHKNIKILVT